MLYHGRVDFTWVHIHPADVIERVDVSFLKDKKKKKEQRKVNGNGLGNVAQRKKPLPGMCKALGSVSRTTQTENVAS